MLYFYESRARDDINAHRRTNGDGPMNNKNHHGDAPKPAARRGDWRQVHHSPLFWVGVFMFLAAITIYVLSDDLSWRPRGQLGTGAIKSIEMIALKQV
jgi:hypothetical protein